MKSLSFFISFALLTLFPIMADAQSNIDAKRVKLGVFVSPSLSWMHPTTKKSSDNNFKTEGNGSKMGFTYGLMLDYQFADNYAFVTGLQGNLTGGRLRSERAGGAISEPSSVNAAEFDYNFNYIEIPAALKMRTEPIVAGMRLFGLAGLTLGINVAKKASYTVDYVDESGYVQVVSDEKVLLKGAFATAPVLLHMNIGAGAEMPLSDNLAAYAGIFFNNGFVPDVTNPNKYDLAYKGTFRDGNTRLNSFALKVGIFF